MNISESILQMVAKPAPQTEVASHFLQILGVQDLEGSQLDSTYK